MSTYPNEMKMMTTLRHTRQHGIQAQHKSHTYKMSRNQSQSRNHQKNSS